MFVRIALPLLGLVCIGGCTETSPAPPSVSYRPAAEPSPTDPMKLDHQEFILELPTGWKQVSTDDPEQFVFESESLDSTITISVMRAAVPRDRLEEIAKGFLTIREQAEHVDPTRMITFGEKWV